MEPIHFHRKVHEPQHDHTGSPAAPNSILKTRKYFFPDRPTDPAVPLPQTSQTRESDISKLSDVFRRTAISPGGEAESYRKKGPKSIAEVLHHWTLDFNFMAEGQAKEKRNPFPGIDLNAGWNRAVCELKMHFEDCFGEPDEKMKIQQAFKVFSLWRQLEPIELEPEELKGIFDMVFMGEGCGKYGWLRIPGSWWATRKNLFQGDRGATFVDMVASEVLDIMEKVDEWKRGPKGLKSELKRKRPNRRRPPGRRLRPFKPRWRKSEKVMSEAWRARRRIQETRAGRWTDGTARMDRLWEGFHWVLPDENWKNYTWERRGRVIEDVDGKDIWGKGKKK